MTPTSRNVSGTKCPKCEKTSFEVVDDSPLGANFDYFYLRCNECKTFLSILEDENTSALIRKLAIKLNVTIDGK